MKLVISTLFLLLFISVSEVISQPVVTEIIQFRGYQGYDLCGQEPSVTGDYDCVTTSGFKQNNYSFFDRVPQGRIVTGVEVTVFNQIGDETAIEVLVNGEVIGDIGGNGTEFRTSERCDVNSTVEKIYKLPGGMPEYKYQDRNTFQIILRSNDKDQEMCCSHAEIKLTYAATPFNFRRIFTIIGIVIVLFIFIALRRKLVKST